MNVHDALTQFLEQPGRKHSTKNKFRTKFKLFLEKYGSTAVSDITPAVIEAWFYYLEDGKGYSEGHLSFHRSCHVTFWSWLDAGDLVSAVPAYSSAPAVIITASDDEVTRLLATCNRLWTNIQQQRDAAIVAMGTAGLRRSNIRSIRTSQAQHALDNPISLDGRPICILPSRGKESMDAVLDEVRAAIIRRYLSNHPATRHDRLFVNLNPTHGQYLQPLSNEGLARARQNVCAAAGLRLISFQELRRWLGSKIAQRKSPQLAAQALGHRSGENVILKHYHNPEKILTQTAVLDAYLFQPSQG